MQEKHFRAAGRRAYEHLRRAAEQASANGAERLPTIVSMADAAGVSPVTMWRAVHRLELEGGITASPGDGIRLTGPAANANDIVGKKRIASRKWQRLHDAILGELAAGAYSAGETLPPVKHLLARYGTSYRTLRKALLKLVDEGHVEPYRTTYRVPHRFESRHSSTILAVESAVGRETLGALDSECSRVGVRLRVTSLERGGNHVRALAEARNGIGDEPLLGYIVTLQGWSSTMHREVLRTLVPAGLPVAFLDQTGGARNSALPGGRLTRVFTIATSARPGFEAGRLLLELGHRRVAYISPAHEEPWSKKRYEGLNDVFALAGLPRHVALASTRYEPWSDTSATRTVAKDLERMIKLGLRQSELRHHVLAEALRRGHTRLALDNQWTMKMHELKPALERLLDDTSITAWVCVNDRTALFCLDLLRTEGIEVPRRLALVGFDDSPDAFAAGLTSYNFNRPAAIRAVVSHVLHQGNVDTGEPRRRTVEIPGFISRRASTGAA